MNGIIFMAYDAQRPVGCIYVEVNPPHLVHSEKQPVFGWLEAENQYVADQTLECRRELCVRIRRKFPARPH